MLHSPLILLCLFHTLAFPPHPLFLSVTEIYHFEDRKEVEVVIRAFANDLEKVINDANGTYIYLQDGDSLNRYQTYVFDYVIEKVDISINKKDYKLNLQSIQLEAQAVKLTFTIPYKKSAPISHIKLKNSILLELNERQINLVRCYIRDETLFMKLTKDHQMDTIEIPKN